MIQRKNTLRLVLLLLFVSLENLVLGFDQRTCDESSGYIACDSALCYYNKFTSCRVICTEGCASSEFFQSLPVVECKGGVGCRGAKFSASTAVCQKCTDADFYFSKVECLSSSACSGANWASGNCCDGPGCPSTVPSCVENVEALCSTRVLDFTIADGGNPACKTIQETSRPTNSPVATLLLAPTNAPVAVPTQTPTFAPTSLPTMSPTNGLRTVQDTEFRLQVMLRGVQITDADDVALFESIVGAWFEQFYDDTDDSIEQVKTIITVTGQKINNSTSLLSTELVFKQQVRYKTRSSAQPNIRDIVSDPFWDATANANLVDQLRAGGGSFELLLGPIGVPEFPVGSTATTSGNEPPLSDVEASSSTGRAGANDDGPPSVATFVAIVLGIILALLGVAAFVFYLRRQSKGATQAKNAKQASSQNNGVTFGGTSGHHTSENSTTDPTSTVASSSASRTFGTSSGMSAFLETSSTAPRSQSDIPHANVMGIPQQSGPTFKGQTQDMRPLSNAATPGISSVGTVQAVLVEGSVQL